MAGGLIVRWHLQEWRRRAVPLTMIVAGGLAAPGCADRSTGPDPGEPKAAAAPDLDWPMTRGGPALSGNVAAGVPLDPESAWTFAASGPVTAEAAIFRGRVFVGTAAGRLHCLSLDAGEEHWVFETEDAITAAPAVTETMAYVASNDGSLYALEALTGKEVWRFATEDKISSGATVVRRPGGEGDLVLVNGYDGTTRALNAADGTVIWSYATDDFINGAPAVVDGKQVVFGGCDAHLHVVSLADGTLVHRIPANAYIPASIGTIGTMAFCGNYANQTVAFDVAAGTVAWVYEDRALPFFSAPAVNDRLVLIGSRDKHLHAIDRRTGEGIWKFRTGGRVEGAPIVFRDGVVFGSSDGRLYAAGLEDGAELWQLDVGESLVAPAAFGAGRIVIGGEKGTVFAIRGRGTERTAAAMPQDRSEIHHAGPAVSAVPQGRSEIRNAGPPRVAVHRPVNRVE